MYKELLIELLKDPDSMANTATEIISQYKPLLYKVLNELFGFYKDLVNNEEYYEYSAKDKMNDYKSLINVGFTEDQAFLLLLDKDVKRSELAKRFSETSKADVKVKH